MGVGGAFQTFPPMAHLAEDEMAAPIAVGKKLTRSQVGWLDLLFRGMISIPALLNEAMAVVLPGEPIPRAKADRVRML